MIFSTVASTILAFIVLFTEPGFAAAAAAATTKRGDDACVTKNYTTVDLNLGRYQGNWFQLAVSESFFRRFSCDCTTAEYYLKPDGDIRVLNTCRRPGVGGSLVQAEGKAVAVGKGKLEVSFGGFPSGGVNYEVVYINNAYSRVIVVSCGKFGGSTVYLLSRDAVVPENEYQFLKNYAGELGFKVDDLVRTDQSQCWSRRGDVDLRKPLKNYGSAIPAKCAQPIATTNFSLTQLEGRWFMTHAQLDLLDTIYTKGCHCNTLTYDHSSTDRHQKSFESKFICRRWRDGGRRFEFSGPIIEVSKITTLLGHYTKKIFGRLLNENFQILAYGSDQKVHKKRTHSGTDIDSLLLYSCVSSPVGKADNLFILSKKVDIKDSTVNEYVAHAKKLGLYDKRHFQKISHGDRCKYDPEPKVVMQPN